MAGRNDPVGEELKAIRKRLNDRLYRAFKEDRLEKEVRTLDREGGRVLRKLKNGHSNGQKRRRKK